MPSTHSKPQDDLITKPTMQKVANATNLYKMALPGDKPDKPTGGYYALVKRGRKQFRRSLKTKDRKLADRRLNKLKGQVGNLDSSKDVSLGFDKIAKRWLALTSHTLKPRSIERRETSLKGLTPYFKGVTIRNISKAHCEAWLTKRGQKISAQSFSHELGVMKRVFDYAVERGLILGNPASHIRRRKIPQAEIAVPTREQFQELIAAIRASDGRASSQKKAAPGANLIELLAYSGMRLGEATSLLWRDVDFKGGTITVTGGEAGTKNRERRVVPMTAALRGLLLRMQKDAGSSLDDRVSAIDNAKTTLRKKCKDLEFPQFSHHDFRHFFATTCIESGVDIPTISRWLGHKDGGALAMRVYGHLRPQHSFSQIKRVNFDVCPAANVVEVPTPGGARASATA